MFNFSFIFVCLLELKNSVRLDALKLCISSKKQHFPQSTRCALAEIALHRSHPPRKWRSGEQLFQSFSPIREQIALRENNSLQRNPGLTRMYPNDRHFKN
jgi:hypothetical protein